MEKLASANFISTPMSFLKMAPVTQNINSQLQRNPTVSNTGERMGDVDLNTHYQMGDQANVTQMEMVIGKGPAVPQVDIVETLMPTANVLDALTSANLLQGVVSTSLSLPTCLLFNHSLEVKTAVQYRAEKKS